VSVKLDPYSRKATDAQRRRAMAPLRYPMILHCECHDLVTALLWPRGAALCGPCWTRLAAELPRRPTLRFVRYATEGGRCYGKAAEQLWPQSFLAYAFGSNLPTDPRGWVLAPRGWGVGEDLA